MMFPKVGNVWEYSKASGYMEIFGQREHDLLDFFQWLDKIIVEIEDLSRVVLRYYWIWLFRDLSLFELILL